VFKTEMLAFVPRLLSSTSLRIHPAQLSKAMSLQRQVQTDKAPSAIGPYSQAIVANGLVFCSGQIGVVPETGVVVEGDIQAQTRRCLQNLQAVLEEAGSGLNLVVKTSVFLKDMNDFVKMNETYAEFFKSDPKPARAAVEVARLPKDVIVEIECVALVNKATLA